MEPDRADRRDAWRRGLSVGVLLVALVVPLRRAHGSSLQASQTFSVTRTPNGSTTPGEAMVAYTALGATWDRWRVRGAFSWWNWQPDDGTGFAGDSGLGGLHLTVGRRIWSSTGTRTASRGWAQVKGVIPLNDTPSPAGSGEFDWGFSLLTTNRFRDFLVFGEVGYLNPGDPLGTHYNSQVSGAISASWHRRGLPVYPVASYVAAGSAVDGLPGYSEWSAGLGAVAGRRAGVLALYSHGTNAGSPGRGLTVVVTFGL
jgi:hypothetical protein